MATTRDSRLFSTVSIHVHHTSSTGLDGASPKKYSYKWSLLNIVSASFS